MTPAGKAWRFAERAAELATRTAQAALDAGMRTAFKRIRKAIAAWEAACGAWRAAQYRGADEADAARGKPAERELVGWVRLAEQRGDWAAAAGNRLAIKLRAERS